MFFCITDGSINKCISGYDGFCRDLRVTYYKFVAKLCENCKKDVECSIVSVKSSCAQFCKDTGHVTDDVYTTVLDMSIKNFETL